MSLKKALLMGCVMFGAIGTVHSESGSGDPSAAPATLFSPRKAPDRKDAESLALRGIDPGPQAAAPLAPPPPRPSARSSAPQAPWRVAEPKPVPAEALENGGKSADIDLAALHYYAQQNDLARVSAEIRQIRSRHPDWQPPDDLFADPADSVDEQPLWDLYSKGSLQGVRDAIAALQRDKPEWRPSADLQSKLDEAEARRSIGVASDAGHWRDVVDLASANEALLTCGNVDVLWRTAEALARLGDEARAIAAYDYVLANCRKPEDRLATVQKASLLLKGAGALDELIAQGHQGADGRSEFEPVRLDRLRREVGEAHAPGSMPPSPQDLDAIASDFDRHHTAADADVLGWHYYGEKNYPAAEAWFRKAMSVSDDAKAVEGLALSLRELGRIQDAETLISARADTDPALRKILIELVSASLFDHKAPAPTPDMLKTFLTAVEAAKSPDGAQAYGWSLYDSGSVAEAASWFKKSQSWQPNEQAVIGMMVAAKRLRQTVLYNQLAAQYSSTYPKIAELEIAMRDRGATPRAARARTAMSAPSNRRAAAASPSRRRQALARAGATRGQGWDAGADAIVKTFESGNYEKAIALLDARRQSKREPSGLSVVRGWAQYHRGDWEAAKQTFSNLHDTDMSIQSREGMRVIQEGYSNPRFR